MKLATLRESQVAETDIPVIEPRGILANTIVEVLSDAGARDKWDGVVVTGGAHKFLDTITYIANSVVDAKVATWNEDAIVCDEGEASKVFFDEFKQFSILGCIANGVMLKPRAFISKVAIDK